MRLLKTDTLELVEFPNEEELPPYAALSHTWEKQEVSFREMGDPTLREEVWRKDGFAKISSFCEVAAAKGLRYGWVDTCCIDKASSAELSEAINSMYRWYGRAAVCIAYLADIADEDLEIDQTAFEVSRWFSRGWTLQELITPPTVEFYSAEWSYFGTRETLKHSIARITRIDMRVLSKTTNPHYMSIAKRMSWASGRNTTRVEDMAYCLMGLFEVNMPLMYGEGEKAFRRLQQEILSTYSHDQSIFAWKNTNCTDHVAGVLAKSPADFVDSFDMILTNNDNHRLHHLDKKGIFIEFIHLQNNNYFLAPLNCFDASGREHRGPVAIYLKQIGHGQDRFGRARPNEFIPAGSLTAAHPRECEVAKYKPFYLIDDFQYQMHLGANHLLAQSHYPEYWFHIQKPPPKIKYYVSHAYPPTAWDPIKSLVKFSGKPFGGAAVIRMSSPSSLKDFTFILEVNINFCATISIAPNEKSLENVWVNRANRKSLQNIWTERSNMIESHISTRTLGTPCAQKPIEDSSIQFDNFLQVQLSDEKITIGGVVHNAFGVHFIYIGPQDGAWPRTPPPRTPPDRRMSSTAEQTPRRSSFMVQPRGD